MSIVAISGKINNGKDAVGNMVNYHIVKKYWKAIDWDFYNQKSHEQRLEKDLLDGNKIKLRHDIGLYETKKFADKLKDTICLWLGCTREQLEDRDFKEKELGEDWRVFYATHYKFSSNGNPSGRVSNIFASEEEVHTRMKEYDTFNGYQVATEVLTPRKLLQILGTNAGRMLIHPNIWVNATMVSYKDTNNWVITDCRFPNEAEAVLNEGGIVIRVNRPIEARFPELWKNFIEQESGLGKLNEEHFLKWLQYIDLDMWKKITHESETSLDNYDSFSYVIENNGTFEDLIEKVRQILAQETIL